MDRQTDQTLSWAVGGQSGEGIDSTGEIFARALHRLGYHVYAFRNFPSRIKGGQATYTVRAAAWPVRCEGDRLDVLVALDPESIADNRDRLAAGALVVHDAAFQPDATTGNGMCFAAVPLTDLAKAAGNPIMKNVVALGLSAGLLGLPREVFAAALERKFGRKGGRVLEQNLAALDKGFAAAAQWSPELRGAVLRLPPAAAPAGDVAPASSATPSGPVPADAAQAPAGDGRRLFLSGNEALAMGALAAGCRFYAGYPITPATEIMTWLIRHLPRCGGAVVQTEDEIAAVTMAIGAGYAGVRAMTATSGPGFSLMMEALSLAGMTETPVVVVDVQRGGPSTGLPTKTEQANLNETIYGSHGDFPRIVLAPATPEDCFHLAAEAFNLAERLQCPVLIASDLALGLAKQSVAGLDCGRVHIERGALVGGTTPAPRAAPAAGTAGPGGLDGPGRPGEPGGYKRYRFTEDGVSPRALPGQPNGRHLVTGDEHDEAGNITEDPETRARMMEKRLGKLRGLDLSAIGLRYEGAPEPELLLVGWGSTHGAISEARRALAAGGRTVAHLHVKALHPFPTAAVAERFQRAGRILVVEQNATGQLAGLIRREAGFAEKLESCLKYDGVPMRPGEILARAEEILAARPRPGDRPPTRPAARPRPGDRPPTRPAAGAALQEVWRR